jgi:hypothetical protein
MRGSAIVLALLATAALSVSAAGQEFYHEFATTGRPFDPTWPADGEEWHQLFPNYCVLDEQTGHDDANGDGYIDVCEHIWFNGEQHHVEWIGPTYKLVYMGDLPDGRPVLPRYAEDASPPGSRQFLYHEVYPNFCNEFETTEPIEFECQEVWVEYPPEDVGWWHVEEINTNIRTVPQSPVEEGTWGRIKAWFGRLLEN